MPTQNLKKLAETIEDYEIGIDNTFNFKCRECGKCCENREDVLLTSRDLFNICRALNLKPEEVVEKYCDLYVGGNSRVPIIRLQPVGVNMRCPFLQDNRCIVHNLKPIVCALYPLGRFIKIEKETVDDIDVGNLAIRYFINSVKCGGHYNNTVRNWLGEFGIDSDDKWYRLWTATTMRLGAFVKKLEENPIRISGAGYEAIWNVSAEWLYIRYDTQKEYIPQFEANIAMMWRAIGHIDKEIIQPFFLTGKNSHKN